MVARVSGHSGRFTDGRCKTRADTAETEICGDGIDNNCDGDVDYDDTNGPFGVEICGNGLDDDCDGDIDEEGSGGQEICGDGIDNNCDGEVDEGCDCDESDPDCCDKKRGKPVSLVSGTTYTDAITDVRVATPEVPLEFVRRYHGPLSKAMGAIDADREVLGPGWSHSYDMSLQVVEGAKPSQTPTAVIISGGTRKDVRLSDNGSGSIFLATGGRREVVEKDTNGWLLHTAEGRRFFFNTDGRLVYIAARSKIGVRIARDAQNKVETVTFYQDATTETGAGPYLQLSYYSSGPESGMLEQVTLHSTFVKTWSYAFTQAGAASPILSQVTHPTTKQVHYDYTVFAGTPPRYALARVTVVAGSSTTLEEYHQIGTDGKTVRTVSAEGDYSFAQAGYGTTAYSNPEEGGACTQTGSCGTNGVCEGTCSTDPSRPCLTDGDCAGTCDFTFGRCYRHCTLSGECGGAHCAADQALLAITTKGGRCYRKKETIAYGANLKVTTASGCSACGSGTVEYTWNTDGTLGLRKRTLGTASYDTFLYDTYLRETNRTVNNSSDADACPTPSSTEPCLRTHTGYTYTDAGRLFLPGTVKETHALTGTFGDRKTTYVYNTGGQVTSVTREGKTRDVGGSENPAAYTTTYGYTSGRLTSVNPPDPAGQSGQDNSTLFTYHPFDGTSKSGQLWTITRKAPPGSNLVTTYNSYSPLGKPTWITLPDGTDVLLGYDAAGRLTSRNHMGQVMVFDYDDHSRLKRIVFAGAGGCNHYQYEAVTGRLIRVIVTDDCPAEAGTSDGDYTTLSYTDEGKLSEVRHFAQGETGTERYYRRFDYDPATGRITKRYDKGTDITHYKRFSHDAFGRLIKLGDELCSDSGVCSSWPGCTCPATTWTYNGLDSVLTASRQLEAQTIDTAYEYDPAGKTKSITASPSSSPVATSYVHDDFGRLIEMSSPDSGVTRFQYDGNNNVSSRRAGVGTATETTTSYTYDGQNRLLTVAHGIPQDHCDGEDIGQDIHYHYDTHPDCASVNMCDHGAGRLVMVEVEIGCNAVPEPIFRRQWFSYDEQGRVVKELYQRPGGPGFTLQYGYNEWGGLASMVLPTGGLLEYGYDTGGRRLRSITHNGNPVVNHIEYAPFGPARSFNLGAQCNSQPVEVQLGWSTNYFLEGVSTSVTKLHTQTNTQDVSPRIASLANPQGSCTFDSDCLPGDACVEATHTCTASLHPSYYSYDWGRRLTCDQTAQSSCSSGQPQTRSLATYQAGQPRLATLEYRNSFTEGEQLTYSYDQTTQGTNRLVSVTRLSGAVEYALDGQGRRAMDTEAGWPPVHEAAAVRHFGYMPNGRLGIVMGQEPVQTEIGGGQWNKTYEGYESWSLYDHRGLRVSKTVYASSGMQTWLFFHDQQGRLVSEILVRPGQPVQTFEYAYLGQVPVYQHQSLSGGGTLAQFFLPNQLGQPVVGLTEDCSVLYRADVDAFGWTSTTGEGLHMPLRSVGQYEDAETRVALFDPSTYGAQQVHSDVFVMKPPLHYNWHRFYDPLVGYYLTTDPLGQSPDVNPYRFVRHDPVNAFDPTGLLTVDVPSLLKCFGGWDPTAIMNALKAWQELYNVLQETCKKKKECRDGFRRFRTNSFPSDLDDMLKYGTDPPVFFMTIPDGASGMYRGRTGNVGMSCDYMKRLPAQEMAKYVFHELGHYANDAAVPGKGTTLIPEPGEREPGGFIEPDPMDVFNKKVCR